MNWVEKIESFINTFDDNFSQLNFTISDKINNFIYKNKLNLFLGVSGIVWTGFSLFFTKASGIFLLSYTGLVGSLWLGGFLYGKKYLAGKLTDPGIINPFLLLFFYVLVFSGLSLIPMSIIWGGIYGIKYLLKSSILLN